MPQKHLVAQNFIGIKVLKFWLNHKLVGECTFTGDECLLENELKGLIKAMELIVNIDGFDLTHEVIYYEGSNYDLTELVCGRISDHEFLDRNGVIRG